jgi:hypothetical protein
VTVTGVVSLAEPVKNGVVLLERDIGELNVTVGGAVSTVNVTGSLVPAGFPSELGCVAIAVYSPLDSFGLTLPEVQLPPPGVAVAFETTDPVAVPPA